MSDEATGDVYLDCGRNLRSALDIRISLDSGILDVNEVQLGDYLGGISRNAFITKRESIIKLESHMPAVILDDLPENKLFTLSIRGLHLGISDLQLMNVQ